MELLTAALVFIAIVGLSVGLWWQSASGEGWPASLATFSVPEALETLIQQSGLTIRPRAIFAIMAALGVVATLLGGIRAGSLLIGLVCGAFAACGPIAFLVFKRGQRLSRFERQLPDSLDMMTRATRAGLSAHPSSSACTATRSITHSSSSIQMAEMSSSRSATTPTV